LKTLKMVETVIDAVPDCPIGEDAGEAAPHRLDEVARRYVQVALVLAGEARIGQVLGRGRAPDRDRKGRPVFRDELLVCLLDLLCHPCRDRGLTHDRAGFGRASGERRHVGGIDPVQERAKARPRAGCVEHLAVGAGQDREAVRHTDPRAGQLPIHLAERRVLASDQRDVLDAHLGEAADVAIARHCPAPCVSWEATALAGPRN
jgi:hypothetical protein